MSTNFAKTLVWKQDYDVKLWRHKQRTPNTNDYPMPLNETPPMKIFCVRHCTRQPWVSTDANWNPLGQVAGLATHSLIYKTCHKVLSQTEATSLVKMNVSLSAPHMLIPVFVYILSSLFNVLNQARN